jgi:hypothetical protein
MKRHLARLGAILFLTSACGNNAELEPTYRSRAELLDPETCKECHANHYGEWAGSMHAYASQDPVFLAMNRRGQEETGGRLGNFCVNCHAPLAVHENATTDGLNLAQLPKYLQGINCYYCHNVEAVEGTHNNPLRLSNDVTMRARFEDPVPNPAHRSGYSPLFSGAKAESAQLCGSCHDIVLPTPLAPAAVELERTFAEWTGSVFAPTHAPSPSALATCNSCHMPNPGKTEPIAEGPGLKVIPRSRHPHQLAGVDVALERFPDTGNSTEDARVLADQSDAIQRLLNITLRIDICVQVLSPDTSAVHITLDNANAGHNWPTGATQDRRAWVEVIAYKGEAPIYQSGVVADGQPVLSGSSDPDLWQFRDFTFDAENKEAHMFWQVARKEIGTIPAQVTNDSSKEAYYLTHAVRRFPALQASSIPGIPDRVTVRVRIRPVGLEVLDDLVATSHLDPAVKSLIPTFDLLPNKDNASHPGLAALDKVSMEWSAGTRASKLFYARPDFTTRPQKDCVGMPKGP